MLDSFQLNDFADDNFTFDENDRKFSKRLENTVEKGKNLLILSNFSFFPQCFQKASTADTHTHTHKKKTQGFFAKELNFCCLLK